MTIRDFIHQHYHHFNAAALKDAVQAYEAHLAHGGKMLVTLAGAMSTAELGISLAKLIRQDKVHAICCTGANLEEDLFNLVAHEHYLRLPHYRDLTPDDELQLLEQHFNRVTDTCLPEETAMRAVEKILMPIWKQRQSAGHRFFPHEPLYQALTQQLFVDDYQIDPQNSWLLAAAEKNLPLFTPGWEDSTLGNFFAAHCYQQTLAPTSVKNGIELMMHLIDWYRQQTQRVGFFQIGGGIAGDFPICVVPLIAQDLQQQAPVWGYFCQISDSTTSYGSYSGAIPNEKITWGKLHPDTPKFIIESDASIIAPLMFTYLTENDEE
ncbi:MAG: deoxyhypusine synthase [Legionellales bacterium]|nr:deoxyhypusine synthase [Legionellales bacterium]